MRQFTWEEYYRDFYDWSPATQKRYAYGLTGYGPAEEVLAVISEFAMNGGTFASTFAVKAMDAGVRFTPEQVMELTILVDKPVLSRMAEQATAPFDIDELEELHTLIDDDAFRRISKKQKINISPSDPWDECEPEEEYVPEMPPPKKPGLPGTLLALFMCFGDARGSTKQAHPGHCTGDCANCPPHYGYRYGRWYYGHGHMHGCEFGGNRGG